jgi:hypothetical protein
LVLLCFFIDNKNYNSDSCLMNNWEIVFSTPYTFEAEVVKNKLQDAGIISIIVNKIDSSYLSFGLAYVYCPKENVEAAINCLNTTDDE